MIERVSNRNPLKRWFRTMLTVNANPNGLPARGSKEVGTKGGNPRDSPKKIDLPTPFGLRSSPNGGGFWKRGDTQGVGWGKEKGKRGPGF